MAISLAVIALSFLGMAVAVAVAAFRVADQVKKVGALVDRPPGRCRPDAQGGARLTEQAQDVMVLVRHEAGAFAQTAAGSGGRWCAGWTGSRRS